MARFEADNDRTIGRGLLTGPSRPRGVGEMREPARVAGLVQLWAPEVGTTIGGRYSEPPQVVGERAADGAWAAVPRLKRRPLSSWAGPQQVKIELKVRFHDQRRTTEPAALVETLRGLQDRLEGIDAPDRPPWIKVIGYVPGHYATVKWQIDGLEITELDHRNGECTQALATIRLAEWVAPTITARLTPAARRPAKRKPWKKGDTLSKFAKRHLGSDGKEARAAIRRANPGVKSWTGKSPKDGALILIPGGQAVSK